MKYHVEHDPTNSHMKFVRDTMKRASRKRGSAKVRQRNMADYKPQFLDDFGFADEVIAFDERYSRILGSHEGGLETGSGPIEETPRAIFTKKSMGLPKTVLFSATERRLGVTRKKSG